jgi:hypothetical protein
MRIRNAVLLAAVAAVAAASVIFVVSRDGDDTRQSRVLPTVTHLTFKVYEEGANTKRPRTLTVTCQAEDAKGLCAQIAAAKDAFAEPGKGKACTQQFGGPQRATVTGVLLGKKIDTAFSLANGCQITRWNKLAFVLGDGTPAEKTRYAPGLGAPPKR